jgi:HSP20 family protein
MHSYEGGTPAEIAPGSHVTLEVRTMASLMRWDPFGDLLALPREVDRFFDWTTPMRALRGEAEMKMLVPTMDVLSRGDDMVVRVELPGIDPSAVDISVTEGTLAVSGERSEEHETTEEDYMLRESSWGRFERRIALPKGVDPATLHADFKDGVLEISIPKAAVLEEPKTHHIAIGSGTQH